MRYFGLAAIPLSPVLSQDLPSNEECRTRRRPRRCPDLGRGSPRRPGLAGPAWVEVGLGTSGHPVPRELGCRAVSTCPASSSRAMGSGRSRRCEGFWLERTSQAQKRLLISKEERIIHKCQWTQRTNVSLGWYTQFSVSLQHSDRYTFFATIISKHAALKP